MFGKGDLRIMPLSNGQIREKQCSKCHVPLREENEVLSFSVRFYALQTTNLYKKCP
jgi:hypothetical protein